MKNLELEKMGVQEMNNTEMNEHTGGSPILIPIALAGFSAAILYVVIIVDNQKGIMMENPVSTK